MRQTKNNKKILKFVVAIFVVAIAGLVGGAGFKSFFDSMETKIVPTGMSGLAMLIGVWLKPLGISLPTSVIYLILNAIIFAFAFKFFGWKFMLLSGVGLGTYVLGMQFGLIPAIVESVNGEPLILCIVGSIITGLATGVAIRFGGSTGGSDVFGKLLNRILPKVKTGYCILIFNAFVLTLSVITVGLSTGLYAIINSILSSLATDFVLDNSKKVIAYFIICNKANEISKGIMEYYNQGVTKFDAKGMFTGNHKHVLLCLVPYDQSYKMRDYVSNIDSTAFIFSTPVTETIGEANFIKRKLNQLKNNPNKNKQLLEENFANMIAMQNLDAMLSTGEKENLQEENLTISDLQDKNILLEENLTNSNTTIKNTDEDIIKNNKDISKNSNKTINKFSKEKKFNNSNINKKSTKTTKKDKNINK